MDDTVATALIGFAGGALALLGRDVVMALILASRRRSQELADRRETEIRARFDLVRLYADPLREAAKSLRIRLFEIIDKAPARYLLTQAPKTVFAEYKKISTLYRLAALLGWIRAFRRERTYLDPKEVVSTEPSVDPITAIEIALADGQHVEEQRLNELLDLWKIPRDAVSGSAKSRLAAFVDGSLREFLSEKAVLSASDLGGADKIDLARVCASLVSNATRVEVPTAIVDACAEQASAFFGIKEAYIYRDWQAALGDMMLVEIVGGRRRFDVIGFGEFEDRYIKAQTTDEVQRRWFDRLATLFHDLDMSKTGMFDARRQQLVNLRLRCEQLETFLAEKTSAQ